MKSVFKIVLNKLRSTFRRSTDQNLDHPHSRESLQDDSEQSSKIKNSRSDSSLGTCSSNILLGTGNKLGDLLESELKKKAGLRGAKQPVIRSVSSATCSPRRAPLSHPPIKQYGSNKSTKSVRSFGSTLSNKSVRSVGQLNAEERATASSVASSTTNLNQQQQQQRKNVSGQNSNDTLSTTSSIAMLFNPPQSAPPYKAPLEQQLSQRLREQQRAGSSQSLLKGDSPDSSSHLSSLADNVPELPNLNEDEPASGQPELRQDDSSYSIKDLDNEPAIFASSPNLYAQSNLQSHSTGQPMLISQSMSMDEPELSDTDSLIGIEIDQAKCRSKSVDASVVIAMKNQSMAGGAGGQRVKPKGSATFLEIPKFRLFVRKPSNASTTNISALGAPTASGASTALGANTAQPNNQVTSVVAPTVIKLADIFKDCVHCKWMDLVEPRKVFPVDAPASDLFSADNNNNTLTEQQPPLEEEVDEELSSDLDSEEQDECQSHSHFASSSLFQGNDFSSTAVYHQQQSQHTSSSMASSSGARRYVKNRQRRSSYNVTYFSKPPANLQQPASKQPPASSAASSATATDRPSSAAGFVKKSPADKQSDEQSEKNDKANSDNRPKTIPSLPSVTLNEASDDEQEKDAMNDLIAASAFGTGETMCISIQITEPPPSCCDSELEDPGSGITVVSLEVPVLNSGKQARSASVDSSFLQVISDRSTMCSQEALALTA